MGAAPKKLSREELKESVDALVDKIVNGDDRYWAEYTARLAAERAAGFRIGLFKTWSANNTFYLQAQVARRRSAVKGLFAGVDQWRKRGRTVRDGEQPYIIFGPPAFRRPAAPANPPAATATQNQVTAPAATAGQNPAQQNQGTAPAAGTSNRLPAANAGRNGSLVFRRPPVIEVFDWTQTAADDPDYVEPQWAVPLAAGDHDTLALLVDTSPVPVRFADIASKNENGWLDATGITVDESMPVGNRIYTLLHELAHHHLGHLDAISSTTACKQDDKDETRAKCEQEAALAQYLAMKMLGLDESVGNDITAAAGTYLRSWTRVGADGNTVPVEGHKTKRKLVLSRLGEAFKAADAIVTAYAEALAERDTAVTAAETVAVPA